MLLMLAEQTHAQQTVPLSISPVKQEVLLERSQRKNLEVTVFNKGKEAISGNFGVLDFIVREADGTPLLLEKSPYSERSAQSWIHLPEAETIIEPQKSSTMNLAIAVPPDAVAGGHYVAIFFQPSLGSREGSSNISVRIVSLVNIKVMGQIKENAMISAFSAPLFLESGPVQLNFSITNAGDYHIDPKGKVILSNMFGNQIDTAPIKELSIFPNALREYKSQVGKNFLLGPYLARISLSYGENGQLLEKDQWLFIFPWKLFLIVLLGLAILYYMGRSFKERSPFPDSRDKSSSRGLSELKRKLKKRNG